MDLKARAKKLKTDIPAIFLALKDKETSLVAKIFAGITVVYALSPIDFVPDFIPVLGYLDDVILLLWGVLKQYMRELFILDKKNYNPNGTVGRK